jgi:hypothetical protein
VPISVETAPPETQRDQSESRPHRQFTPVVLRTYSNRKSSPLRRVQRFVMPGIGIITRRAPSSGATPFASPPITTTPRR